MGMRQNTHSEELYGASSIQSLLCVKCHNRWFCDDEFHVYHRDSRQEFEKVGGIFPILHVVFLLDASN